MRKIEKTACDLCPMARRLVDGTYYCPFFSCARELFRDWMQRPEAKKKPP